MKYRISQLALALAASATVFCGPAAVSSAWAQTEGQAVAAPESANPVAPRKAKQKHARRDRTKTAKAKAKAKPDADNSQMVAQAAPPSGLNQPGQRVEAVEADRPKIAVTSGGVQNKTVITSDAVRNQGVTNTYDAIARVPGVTQSDAKGGSIADNVQIRGIHLPSNTGYRLDGGLPVENDLIMPIEDKAAVQALKGASALAFGLASPSGVINYPMKRAGDKPNASFGFAANQFGQLLGTLDVGSRFGWDQQFGIRTIISGGEMNNGVAGATGVKGLAAVTADWNLADRLHLKLDFEQFGVNAIEQATLLQAPAVVIPGRGLQVPLPRMIPNYYNLMSGPWAKYQGVGQNIWIGGTYLLDYGWLFDAEWGQSEVKKYHRNLGQVGNYNVFTGLGSIVVTQINDQFYENQYWKTELKNHYEYSFISSDVTFGANYNGRNFNGPVNGTYKAPQNIFSPFVVPAPPPYITPAFFFQNTYDMDYYVQEDLSFFNRVHLLGGVREINYHGAFAQQTGGINTTSETTPAPAFGIVATLLPNLEAYASYLRSLQETGQAPQNSANAFQVLPPAQGTQTEVGFRFKDWYNATGTLAAFEINQANAFTSPVTNIYAISGTENIRGIEGTLEYRIWPQDIDLRFVSGGQMGLAKQIASDPAINGKEVQNTPRLSGNVGFAYRPELIHGLALNINAAYTGARQLNNLQQGKLPGYTLMNIGATYETNYDGHPLNFYVSISNLLDIAYYSSAVNGALGVGRPQTINFGGRLSF
jgi:iron complex outermembrane receptor protein